MKNKIFLTLILVAMLLCSTVFPVIAKHTTITGNSSNQQLSNASLNFIQTDLFIDGDADFISKASSFSWPGSGTDGSPYQIFNYFMNKTNGVISIKNTDLHFQMYNVTSTTFGLVNVSNFVLSHNNGIVFLVINSSLGSLYYNYGHKFDIEGSKTLYIENNIAQIDSTNYGGYFGFLISNSSFMYLIQNYASGYIDPNSSIIYDTGAFRFVNCLSSEFYDNTAFNSKTGFDVLDTNSSMFERNTAVFSKTGFHLYNSNSNSIQTTIVSYLTVGFLVTHYSTNNTINANVAVTSGGAFVNASGLSIDGTCTGNTFNSNHFAEPITQKITETITSSYTTTVTTTDTTTGSSSSSLSSFVSEFAILSLFFVVFLRFKMRNKK